MTALQKVIKYLATAFAIFLSISIIGGILMGLTVVSYFLSGKGIEPAGNMQTYSVEGEISSLSVDLSGAQLKIKTGDTFSVESNHEYISVNIDHGELSIRETKKLFAFLPKGVTVIISIPENFVFENASIDTGAGKVEIDNLSADVLKLSLGAGKAEIHNLTANVRAKIDGGAGELTVDGGKLCNLDLDMGVGKLILKSRVEGDSGFDCGIGETRITLLGSREDYKIKIDKGIGDAKLAGETMNDDSVYGTGSHYVKIDSGIGAVSVDFSDFF